MNLYTAAQTRAWDAFTIAQEPVTALELIERAAGKCAAWIQQQFGTSTPFIIFCGKGNNGGDGLVIARLLLQQGAQVRVFVLETGQAGTDLFDANLKKLQQHHVQAAVIASGFPLPYLDEQDLVIDALFGAGLNRPLDGLAAQLVQHINAAAPTVVSIDVPTGLLLTESSLDYPVVQARYTLSFQAPKMAFLLPENEVFTGELVVLDIGLHPRFPETANMQMLDKAMVQQLYRPRSRFGHKGTYGHVLMVGGSVGKMGAVALSTKAALRAGAGLVSALVPKLGYHILQTTVPEAMCITDPGEDRLTGIQLDTARFAAIGIGPGMNTSQETLKAFSIFISRLEQPVVADADALNCLAQDPALLSTLPKGSVLTPHPKEFERLFGPVANDFDRISMALEMAKQFRHYIVLKGHHSFIATPDGAGYFNSTGNAGMATGGSGDVLTGIIAALIAQGYSSLEACLLGVYLHGLAGDLAVAKSAPESLIASDIIEHLGAAFAQLVSRP